MHWLSYILLAALLCALQGFGSNSGSTPVHPTCVGLTHSSAESSTIFQFEEHEYRLILGESRFGDANLPAYPPNRDRMHNFTTQVSPLTTNMPLQQYTSMLGLIAQLIGFQAHGYLLHAPQYEGETWSTGQGPTEIPFPYESIVVSVKPDWPLERMITFNQNGTSASYLHEETLILAAKYDADYYDTPYGLLKGANLTVRDRRYLTLPFNGSEGSILGRKVTLKSELAGDSFDHRRMETSVRIPNDGDQDLLKKRMHELLHDQTPFLGAYPLEKIASLPNTRLAVRLWATGEGAPRTPIASVAFDSFQVIKPDGSKSRVLNEIEIELLSQQPEVAAWIAAHRPELELFLQALRTHVGGVSEWSQEPKLSRGLKAF